MHSSYWPTCATHAVSLCKASAIRAAKEWLAIRRLLRVSLQAAESHIHVMHIHSQKKRYKSCHWGCTLSKDKLLYPKAAYWYLSGTYQHLICALGPKMEILAPEMYTLTLKMYIST